MRHHVVQSVSAVTTSVGRFAPAWDAARGGRGAPEARSEGAWAAALRTLSLSSATRCSAARSCSGESSYFCESVQTAAFLYLSGTTSAIWVRPLSSTHRQMDVASALVDRSQSAMATGDSHVFMIKSTPLRSWYLGNEDQWAHAATGMRNARAIALASGAGQRRLGQLDRRRSDRRSTSIARPRMSHLQPPAAQPLYSNGGDGSVRQRTARVCRAV